MISRVVVMVAVLAVAVAGIGWWVLGPPVPEFIELPPELREISGLTVAPDGRLVAVQDELGSLFFVDLEAGRTTALPFGGAGDYEDVVAVDSAFWVLRSDGRLRRVEPRGDQGVVTKKLRLPVDGEYEALAYDAAAERLLVMPKARLGKKARRKAGASYPVFAVDLRGDPEVLAAPMIDLPVTAWQDRLPGLEPRITAAVMVPGTSDLLVLSGPDRMVLRLDAAGALLDAFEVPSALTQPEAMTITPAGVLFVASEGGDGPALMLNLGAYR